MSDVELKLCPFCSEKDVREKLVKLLVSCEDIVRSWRGTYGEAADHLLAHGVTVQEWIPVNEPPKEKGIYQVFLRDKEMEMQKSLQLQFQTKYKYERYKYG